MPLELLDDVIEEICDVAGIYGSHSDDDPCGNKLNVMCRACATSNLRDRIIEAVSVEKQLGRIK